MSSPGSNAFPARLPLEGLGGGDSRLFTAHRVLRLHELFEWGEVGIVAAVKLTPMAAEHLVFEFHVRAYVDPEVGLEVEHPDAVGEPQRGGAFEGRVGRLVATRSGQPGSGLHDVGGGTVVGMVVVRRVGDDECRSEGAQVFDDRAPRGRSVDQFAVGGESEEGFGFEQSGGLRHFRSATLGQIIDRRIGLSSITAAEAGDGHRCPLRPGAGQRSGAQQFGIAGMRDDGHDSLVGQIDAHNAWC